MEPIPSFVASESPRTAVAHCHAEPARRHAGSRHPADDFFAMEKQQTGFTSGLMVV